MLFFSATMPPEAQELADQLLTRPETVAVTPSAITAERVDQEVYFVEKADKRALLVDVLRDTGMRRVLVFSRTKHGANRIAEHLVKAGIGIDDVTHVVNFDVPEVPETYVHRIGRTARAGATGMALSFCEADERTDWRNIEKLTRQEIPIVEGHPYESRVPFSAAPRAPAPPPAKPPHQPHSHGRRDPPAPRS